MDTLKKLNQLIAEGVEFSVAVDTVVFEGNGIDRNELIASYDQECCSDNTIEKAKIEGLELEQSKNITKLVKAKAKLTKMESQYEKLLSKVQAIETEYDILSRSTEEILLNHLAECDARNAYHLFPNFFLEHDVSRKIKE